MTDVQEMEAKQNFLYIPEGKMIKIIHMPKLWSEDPDLKLILSSRLVGHDEDFENVEDAITSFNFDTTKNAIYQDLVDQYNIWIKDTLKTAIKIPGYKLTSVLPDDIVPEVEEVLSTHEEPHETISSVMDETVPIKHITKTVKRPKKPVNLQPKIDKLENNKIIDVSNMNEYGVGIKTAVYNKTKHADKYILKNKTLMSDNYKSLMYALNLLKGGKEKYIKDIRKAEKFFDIKDPYIEQPTKTKGKKTPKMSKYDKYKPKTDSDEFEESEPEMEPKPKKKGTPKSKKVESDSESEPEMEPTPKKKQTPKSKKVESDSEDEPKKKRTPKSKKSNKFVEVIGDSESEMEPRKKRTPKSKKVESEESEPEMEPRKKRTPKK